MANVAEKFCGRWYRCDRGNSLLVLAGDTNCGKTHTAAKIHRFGMACGQKAFDAGAGKTWTGASIPSVSFFRWPEVADQIRAKDHSPVDDLKEVDLAILDDVGAENDPFKEVANVLCQVLTRRERKFTVITTNIRPEEWTERFDSRITDRMLRNSVVVDLFGLPSYAMIQP